MKEERVIYFDYNATAPMLQLVREEMYNISNAPLNPSSPHSFGRKAKSILEAARKRVSRLAGCSDDYQLIFTSSGTESNNIALKGMVGFRILTTTIEHASVLKVAGEGLIPVDKNGIVRLDILEQQLKTISGPILVSVQYANNETGVIQPLEEIVKIAKKYGAIVHTDATQAFGKVSFSAESLGVDMVTLSGHKFGGPVGAAALLFKKSLPIQPIMLGGGQEHRFRPGTQNVAAIHGFGVASEAVLDSYKQAYEIEAIRNHIERVITEYSPRSIVFGKESKRLPNTLSITMPDVLNETQVIHFDTNGIAVSAGAACSSGRVDLPYVQMSMGYEASIARTAIRVSLGLSNTIEEVDKFLKLWKALYNKSELTERAA